MISWKVCTNWGYASLIKIRKGLSGVERGKGTCCQWKEKGQCSKGDQRSFRHESNDCAPKPTLKAAPPSEPSMTRGRSASRKRSVRGRSQTGRILRQPCRYHLKGTCTRSLCEYWHPPECQFCQTESGCKAGDKRLFPYYKAEEQPSNNRKWAFNPQNGQSDDKGAVAILKTVPQLGCLARLRAIRTSKEREVSGKPEAQSFGINPMSTIHTVYATSSKYPTE